MGLDTFPTVAFPLPLLLATLKGKKQVIEVSLDPSSSKENLSGPHTLMTQIMERVSDLVSASN